MDSDKCCCKQSANCCNSSPCIRTLSPDWGLSDILGMIRVRLGFGRMSYGMEPGLYAMGSPTPESPVLVTANYKLTVDVLRRELRGRDLWILVLDTANINVWCAAGKGSFGTAELAKRIETTRLAEIVTHRRLILPQLGAPGVAAHKVMSQTRFHVVYGPVRAKDIPEFLDNGQKATPQMRRVTFPLGERLVLTPVELRQQFRPALILILALGFAPVVLLGWNRGMCNHGLRGVVCGGACWLAGCLLGPVLLPWLPGRAFWLKGAFLGAALAAGLALAGVVQGLLPALGGALWLGAGVSFLLMNFTGCATFTSQSGVKQEMKAIPAQIAAGTLGLVLWSTNWWL
ncbi:MAG: mercury methylation corrinoid protein HgcA [Verrucomicrobia bacterium]|nr:mercury methylation corrinoid protein HgcA [Verrucomicrobiota bacterium]